MKALVAGEVQMAFVGEANMIGNQEKFRVLAVTGERRLGSFPNLPTFAELGHPQIHGLSLSLNAPVGTAQVAMDKLYAAASRALQQPEVKELFTKVQMEIVNQIPERAAEKLAEEAKIFADIAKKVGIRPE